MRTAALIILIILFSITIRPQNKQNQVNEYAQLYGYVVDSVSNMPLPGANVILKGDKYGASTDSTGYYEIYRIYNGIYSVRASYLGFETVFIDSIELKGGEKRKLNIQLVDDRTIKEREWAKRADIDIQEGKIRLLVGGLVFADTLRDNLAKKYGFYYELMGCTFFEGRLYNKKMYDYLESIHGSGWGKKFNKELKELSKERDN